jgi:hypothetical protein
MSSCEAELVALADVAIELLHIVEVVRFLGHPVDEAIFRCAPTALPLRYVINVISFYRTVIGTL